MASVARRLIARGDAMDVVVPDVGAAAWHADLRAAGATLHVVPNEGWAAARTVARLRGDLVHAHFHDWLAPVTTAVWLSKARLVWHMHSTSQPDGKPLRVTPRRALKYRGLGLRVERFVCVSEAIAADARALGAASSKIVVVRNAVDTARFHPPDQAERSGARARLGLGHAPAVAFFGRDPVIKGADLLAAALERLPGVTVVAVATPAGAVAELAKHAAVIDVPFTDDVRGVLWAADAVALPSRGEGLPFVALEALACGLAVVASDLPWAAELAASRPEVRLANSADPASLSAALRAALAESPPLPAAHPADGLDAWADAIVALYDRSVGPRDYPL
jgi:glycosyltransferase involved in cell wall biosynthesis